METREKILDVAIEQFSRYGVRNTTMDDIARMMGISKKTLYQEFKDKKELVNATFSAMLERDQEKMAFLKDSGTDVIEHLVKISKMMRERLTNINPLAIMEVQKYFPEAWKIFEEHKEQVIMTDFVNILERGKQLGYFRSEIDAHILARLRVNQIASAMEPSNFNNENYNLVEEQMQMMDHFLHGIFTEKGREAYQEQQAKLS
ncbi:MAG TPA: TetR/AcrR family transcriptional regulator [Algoriphagus sp.]|uniref:TetR/AcrR family transcriptional regulator n=2 Tax=Algoriphagus TaxID=246875 RepID=UPI000C3B3AC7|nr:MULTISPECIES: TetR/AcrR family transcriptional regulator [unclassified Algoriphagus]MAL15190.1 TetR family transcriptional regulator [Algoriphagus sp.]QYH37818.1 TetR/AcrR family transcriptional regulator [Algoriphagus sp. NBT04N3]HAH38661.1 TetR/AcrR family transcriptional regulator [Algoriphagus sp.]HAS60197.1 TetR/AcrR family transcriptional regulator [Algoriphagus sp.]HAZ25211.1 TetR/AcrR family transcriptional regulator [Algoriphagus sp.]